MLLELHHWRNSPRGRGLRRLADLVGGFGDRDGRNLRSGARANRLLQRFLNGDGIAECRQFEIIKTRAADFDATVIKDAPEKILNELHFLNCAELQVVCRAANETTAIDEPLIGDADFRGPDAYIMGMNAARAISNSRHICDEDKQSEDGPSQPITNGWKARPIENDLVASETLFQIAHRSTFSSVEAQIRRLACNAGARPKVPVRSAARQRQGGPKHDFD